MIKTGKIIVCIVICLVAVACGVVSRKSSTTKYFNKLYPPSTQTTYLYTEALKTYLGNNPEAALAICRTILAKDSAHAPSQYLTARILHEKEPVSALPFARKASDGDSTNVWYKNLYGRLLLMNQQYDDAFPVFEALTRQAPNDPSNYRILAALYEQKNQPFAAISLLEEAENKFGFMEELSDIKRELLIQVSLFDKAITESKLMIAKYPYNENNYVVLAQLYAQTGKDSLAMENYRQALALNPDNIDMLMSINEYYARKDDYVNFFSSTKKIFESDNVPLETKLQFMNERLVNNRQTYQQYFFEIKDLSWTLLIKYPNDYKVMELYAGQLIASGGIEQALSLYKSFLGQDNKKIEIYNTIVDIETYLQRPDSVVKYADMAIKQFPDNTELYLRKGVMMSTMGKKREAFIEFDKGLQYAATDSMKSVIYGIIGDLHHENKDFKQTYRYYDKALKKDVNNIVVLNNYSYYISTDSTKTLEMNKALEMAEKAIALAPGNPTYLDTYGWVLYKMERFVEAKKIMQQAVSLDNSNSKELLIHYGDILYELKEYFMASIYWKKALDAGYDAAEITKRLHSINGK